MRKQYMNSLSKEAVPLPARIHVTAAASVIRPSLIKESHIACTRHPTWEALPTVRPV